MQTLTILGANGFVGRKLCDRALATGYRVHAVSRADWTADPRIKKIIEPHPEKCKALFADSSWAVNCIGRAHVLEPEDADEAIAKFREINRDLAVELARKAEAAGITRYVHVSSVAAVRSTSEPGEIIDDTTIPDPNRAYGLSKLEADKAMLESGPNPMAIACLRPPAMVGPHPTGFVRKFARMAKMGIPLPIGAVSNARSFMSVNNFAAAVLAALESKIHGAYIVTDSPPMSVGNLYREMLAAAGFGNRSIAIPAALIDLIAAGALGQRKDSLLGSAAYSGEAFRDIARWTPHEPLNLALEEMMATL